MSLDSGNDKDEASTSNANQRKKRVGVDYHKSAPRKRIEDENGSDSESESENAYSPDATDDEYLIYPISKKMIRNKADCRITSKANVWAVETQSPNIQRRMHGSLHAGFRSNRRARGRGRGVGVEMLDEHRQYVQELREDEILSDVISHTPVPKIIVQYTEGIITK